MSQPGLREKLKRLNQRNLFHPAAAETANSLNEGPPVNALARAEAVQRLQVGLLGIVAMVLLVGLASIIGGQVEKTDQLAVPEAAPTTEPGAEAAGANPLADAGVVPDIAVEPSPSPSVKPLDLPPPGAAPANVAPAQ
ncbi:MAG: hypothetical protein ACKO01_12760 [Erythrobacter sp.]